MKFQKGHKMSAAMKAKISATLTGRARSAETKAKISASNKGQIPWNTGKKRLPFSSEHRKRISAALVGKSPWNKNRKMLSIRGEKHWNWKGGKPKHLDKVVRQSLEYRLWRKSVYERDNFTCQKYGIVGGKLVAHHVNNFAEYPELRFAIDNGITLSEKAHREFHKKYGQTNNTREQLTEFLQ